MPWRKEALEAHEKWEGKIDICCKAPYLSARDLSLAYTPGVAEPCKEIAADKELLYKYTGKGNMVAVVSDGTAVLGLGNLGGAAALPVMEGKAVLFKGFAGVNAYPICLATQDIEEIVQTVKNLEPNFGGINLEDIAAPKCFIIEERLKKELDIPVFHDDQHGTAIVVLAGLLNALKIAGKRIEDILAVVNGSGSAGIAITKLLMDAGLKKVIMCDKEGALHPAAPWLNEAQQAMAAVTNPDKKEGLLTNVIQGADVFIGVSAGGVLTSDMVSKMASNPIIFAMANPVPEIMPEEAKAAGAYIIATGRSDFPNQINNVLAFPGIFRGALDVRAREINERMKVAAAHAIASLIANDELGPENIIPKPFNPEVAPAVAEAVARAAIDTGVARVVKINGEVAENTRNMVELSRRQLDAFFPREG